MGKKESLKITRAFADLISISRFVLDFCLTIRANCTNNNNDDYNRNNFISNQKRNQEYFSDKIFQDSDK